MGYIRRSLNKEDFENQKFKIERAAREKGWTLEEVYYDTEHGDVISRDGLRRCLRDAAAGKWDVLVVTSLDRLTRGGPAQLFDALQVLKELGVDWHSVDDPIPDAPDPFIAKMLRDMVVFGLGLGAMVEQRAVSIRNKANAARLKAMGVKLGRPKGRKDTYPRVRRWKKRPPDADSFRALLRDDGAPEPS